MRTINLSSTVLMTSKDKLQPLRVLPKPIFTPWNYIQRSKYSFGSDQPSSVKFSTQGSFRLYCQKSILNSFRDLPKLIFNPNKVHTRLKRTSWNYINAIIALLWVQSTSLQPFSWLSKIIFKIPNSQLR